MVRITNLAASLTRRLHRWIAAALAALVATEIVRLYQHDDPRGIAAVAAIVGTTVALYLAATCRDTADTLATIAATAAAGVAALEEIERSLGEIEHAAGLAEESLDLLGIAATSLTGSADGSADGAGGDQHQHQHGAHRADGASPAPEIGRAHV